MEIRIVLKKTEPTGSAAGEKAYIWCIKHSAAGKKISGLFYGASNV